MQKSVRKGVDPKKTPKKFSIKKSEELTNSNKIANNFYLLKPKNKLITNKSHIQKDLLNSKLIEPMIEEKMKEKSVVTGSQSVHSAHIKSAISFVGVNSSFSCEYIANSARQPMRLIVSDDESVSKLNSKLSGNLSGNLNHLNMKTKIYSQEITESNKDDGVALNFSKEILSESKSKSKTSKRGKRKPDSFTASDEENFKPKSKKKINRY